MTDARTNSTEDDLSWLMSPPRTAGAVTRSSSADRMKGNEWAPIDQLIDATFGPPPLEDLLRDDSNESDSAIDQQKSSSTTSKKRPSTKAGEDPGILEANDERMKQTHELIREGARAPSAYLKSNHDLEQTPARMTGFPGAVELWPHQLAGAGRLRQILIVHFCALLAWEMGLGKTFVAFGQCFKFLRRFHTTDPAQDY